MGQVFNAKRNEVSAKYEFLDGVTTEIVIVSLSTKESKEVAEHSKDETTNVLDHLEKAIRFMLQRNDKKIVDKIMKEQNDEGNLGDFFQAISSAIDEEKKAKGNG